MTILHVEKTVADNTIWFDNPIQKSTNLSLVSCNFVNKMMNLSSEGTITYPEGNVIKFPKGNYSNITQIKSIIDKEIFLGTKPVSIEGNYLIPSIDIKLNDSLAKLLNLNTNLKAKSRNKLTFAQIPSGIYIHCSIIGSKHVMRNNEYSQVLAYINTKSLNDTISYNPERLYIPANHGYINSIRVWVTDTNNQLIKDGLYPMHLVLDII